MSKLSKHSAMKLVEQIRSANVGSYAMASRHGGSHVDVYFVGGLQVVLQSFLNEQGCTEAATALGAAMNDAPTEAELNARLTRIAGLRHVSSGAAA